MNNTVNQLDRTDTYRTLHPTTAEYAFFSSACNILQDRPYLRPYSEAQYVKKEHTTQSMFSGNNGLGFKGSPKMSRWQLSWGCPWLIVAQTMTSPPLPPYLAHNRCRGGCRSASGWELNGVVRVTPDIPFRWRIFTHVEVWGLLSWVIVKPLRSLDRAVRRQWAAGVGVGDIPEASALL